MIYVYDNSEASYIEALDAATGSTRWHTAREEYSTWATPLVWQHDGRTEIVTSGKKEIRSYSTDGELLWHFDGRMSSLTIPSPLVADGLLYITSGYFQDKIGPSTRSSPARPATLRWPRVNPRTTLSPGRWKQWGRITLPPSSIAGFISRCSTRGWLPATTPRPANWSTTARVSAGSQLHGLALGL